MKLGKFAVSALALLAFSIGGWASEKMRTTIHIADAVTVGSVQLAPGAYTVRWTENGSDAQVTFVQGKRIIGTLPAHVTQARSGTPTP
jgi:hypothetical protein